MPSYKHTRPYIKEEYFKIPRKQVFYDYFPDFLKKALDEYVKIYHDNLLPQIDHKIIPSGRKMNFLYRNIKILCTKIIKTIDFYYQGKIFEASKCFNECLDKLMFDDIKPYETITDNVVFYRARVSNGKQFKKKDLFHIDFISRHLVSTNRYSIPGFPALYLGDSSYVCWEEFNRPLIKDLWFSRFENKEELNIIKFQRIEDFLQEMDSSDLKNLEKYTYLLRYLATFPLVLACTIKVRESKGNFKPEYIIPQLLLQYVSRNEEIDGVKFPSTKVDYTKIKQVKAYNYVFPVKTVEPSGYCNILKSKFHMTEPTSIELEDTLFNPEYTGYVSLDSSDYIPENTISLIVGDERDYFKTAFGRIERKLLQREVSEVK